MKKLVTCSKMVLWAAGFENKIQKRKEEALT
jgi:hypothetical protein